MPWRLHSNSDTMNILAKTTYGKFVMVCHGKFRDLSGVAVIKCKKASKKISANFNLADQVFQNIKTEVEQIEHS